jgi:signal peptidase II
MLILYFVLIAFLVFADQFSKRYAVHKVKEVNTLPVRVGVLKFVIVRNPGAAFGLMAKRRLLLIIITTIMVLMLLA